MADYSIINDISSIKSVSSPIMAMGVGGAGGNAIEHMWQMNIEGVNLAACNTDQDDLDKLHIPQEHRILLGEDGLGAGNNSSVGASKATESLDAVRNLFTTCKTKMLFLAAGMGGGTGTGAAPVIAELAHELEILTVAIVTTPPTDEGPHRSEQAKRGIENLRKWVDSIIILSNDAINELYGDLPLQNSFDRANDVVAFAAKGIAEIVTHKNNLVNVDFADVCTVMKGSGCAIMGVATASGEDRAEKIVDMIVTSPLFGNASIAGARDVLINISVADSNNLTADEARRVRRRVQHYAKSEDENGGVKYTNIIWGMSVKPNLGENDMEVIVVATGFPADNGSATIIKAPDAEQPPVVVEEAKPETTPFKRESTMPSSVSNIIRRPIQNFDEIEALKRVPAWKAHGITLTQATTVKSTTAPKSNDTSEITPSLF
ncbi:MAG: cell division FtsZ family protein [Alistipes sp.]|nr:cell division FtsZ family protein [Alistipes sp.]